MSRKRNPFLLLLAFAALLVTGALNRQALFSTDAPTPASIPAPSTRAREWVASDLSPEQVIQAFLSRYGQERITWYRGKVRQRMNLPDSTFDSDSTVVLGPEGCARLTVNVRGIATPAQLEVVSDGKNLAKSIRLPGRRPNVSTTPLPRQRDGTARTALLATEGCCGPDAVLRRILPQLKNLKILRSGKGEDGLVRLQGETDSDATGYALPPRKTVFCNFDFDSKTHWLTRVEWVLAERNANRVFLVLEFETPVINQPMTEDECVRAFTFRADH